MSKKITSQLAITILQRTHSSATYDDRKITICRFIFMYIVGKNKISKHQSSQSHLLLAVSMADCKQMSISANLLVIIPILSRIPLANEHSCFLCEPPKISEDVRRTPKSNRIYSRHVSWYLTKVLHVTVSTSESCRFLGDLCTVQKCGL